MVGPARSPEPGQDLGRTAPAVRVVGCRGDQAGEHLRLALGERRPGRVLREVVGEGRERAGEVVVDSVTATARSTSSATSAAQTSSLVRKWL